MALYRQLKFPSTFIEYRSVSEWKGVVVISNFDSLEAKPLQIYRPRQLPILPRPKFATGHRASYVSERRALLPLHLLPLTSTHDADNLPIYFAAEFRQLIWHKLLTGAVFVQRKGQLPARL